MYARSKLVMFALAVSLLGASVATGCSKRNEPVEQEKRELPPLTFTDDTSDLLITYIDEGGTTHIVSSPKVVPPTYRGLVRVEPQTGDDTYDPIYVANLDERSADGSYTAHSYAREDWDSEISRRRRDGSEVANGRKRPSQSPGQSPSSSASAAPSADDVKIDPKYAAVHVIVYGTQHCPACKNAMSYLKRKGIKTTFKDIETDRKAHVEMKGKAPKKGYRGEIPVIDVSGKVIVGYSPRSLDAALSSARATML